MGVISEVKSVSILNWYSTNKIHDVKHSYHPKKVKVNVKNFYPLSQKHFDVNLDFNVW